MRSLYTAWAGRTGPHTRRDNSGVPADDWIVNTATAMAPAGTPLTLTVYGNGGSIDDSDVTTAPAALYTTRVDVDASADKLLGTTATMPPGGTVAKTNGAASGGDCISVNTLPTVSALYTVVKARDVIEMGTMCDEGSGANVTVTWPA